MLCEGLAYADAALIAEMNNKVEYAAEVMSIIYDTFEKDMLLPAPFFYNEVFSRCDRTHYQDMYHPYWYHPDHLGSSSYITNLDGEINQHMEYLPFGETLVEEHLNSYNSPFKFNAKEFDAETGNYYYGARYYNPKWSVWLSVDPLAEKFPDWSPYNYTLNNPLRYIDPDGKEPIDPRSGKQIRIDLWRDSPISGSINTNKSNRDNILYNRVNRNLFGIEGFSVPRERQSPRGTWAEGASSRQLGLSSHRISNNAKDIIKSEFGLSNVYASGAPSDNMWSRAANSGSYAFLASSYSENEFGRENSNIQAINVVDNYVTGIVNLSMNDSGNYEVDSVTSFSIEKGEIKSREVSTFFGLFTRNEQYRELNVQETTQNFQTGEAQTKNYITEEIIK